MRLRPLYFFFLIVTADCERLSHAREDSIVPVSQEVPEVQQANLCAFSFQNEQLDGCHPCPVYNGLSESIICRLYNVKSIDKDAIKKMNATIKLEYKKKSILAAGHLRNIIAEAKVLWIDNQELNAIEARAFSGVKGVQILILTNNKIDKMDSLVNIIHGMRELKALYFESNVVDSWTEENSANYLSPIDLGNLKMISFAETSFEELPDGNLDWLSNVSYNVMGLQHSLISNMDLDTFFSICRHPFRLDLSNSNFGMMLWQKVLNDKSKSCLRLRELSLAKSLLHVVPVDLINSLSKTLRFLSMWGNPIGVLTNTRIYEVAKKDKKHPIFFSPKTTMNDYILNLPNLEELDLSSCGIVNIPIGYFIKMPNLKYLHLASNKVFEIDPQTFLPLKKLEYLNLDNNVASSTLIFSLNLTSLASLVELDYSKMPIYHLDTSYMSGVYSKLKNLSLVDTNLNYIHHGFFSHFQELVFLNLSQNPGLGDFNFSGIFQNTSKLEILDLSHSDLTLEYNCDFLHDLKNLKELYLSKNFIKNLSTVDFKGLYQLKFLDVRYNQIIHWSDRDLFLNTRLDSLKIDFNKLVIITDAMLHDFAKIKQISLVGNSFYCDCYVIDLVNMVENKSISIKDWNVAGLYQCIKNNMEFYDFTQINSSELNCSSTKLETKLVDKNFSINFIIIIVVSVSLGLIILSVIIYCKRYPIRSLAISLKNSSLMNLIYKPNKDPDKFYNYDVFISYCDKDRSWVLNNLIKNLECDLDIKLCLHERDFQVGMSILENIFSSMDNSRYILLVISHSFLKSNWCQFELHLAQHRLLETKREELIIILLEDIPKSVRPKMLNYLMLTKTYILWPQRDDSRDIFWKRLRKAIMPSGKQFVSDLAFVSTA